MFQNARTTVSFESVQMETRTRFATQPRDPFAGSVLFGSGGSPQAAQSHSPVMTHSSTYGLSPMQAMDGVSTIRSPYQSKRFGTQDAAPLSSRKTPQTAGRRPPLSSILDDKPMLSHNNSEDDLYARAATGPVYMSAEDSTTDSARKFPLYSSSSLRTDLFNQSTGRLGLAPSTPGGEAGLGKGFTSPAPARPPLRSVVDGYTGRSGAGASASVGASEDSHSRDHSATAHAAVVSPVLTLGPYTPSMDRLEAAWANWVVVSGFYPSAPARDAVLQQFLRFGDILDHVVTSGNWLFIRYASPVHAERAASQHGTLLDSNTLLSVLLLNPRLAQHLNIHLRRDGSLEVENCVDNSSTTVSPAETSGATNGSAGSHSSGLGGGLRQRGVGGSGSSAQRGMGGSAEERSGLLGADGEANGTGRGALASAVPDLYLQPHRRKSVCERIVEYFFAY